MTFSDNWSNWLPLPEHMNWSLINRKTVKRTKPAGAYTNLDDLVRLQFSVSDFSLLPSQPVSSILSGRYASRLRGRGLNFEELRRYQPGDDIRTMDWKVTARTRTPHVRVYTEEKDRVVLLAVDQRINMFFGTRTKFKSVTAAELAAIAAWRALQAGDRIGAIVFNDTDLIEFAPRRSQQNVMSILGTIVNQNHQLAANLPVEPNEAMLNRALARSRQLAPHDALVIVISDFFGVDEQSERYTAELAVHNDVLGLLPFDPIRKQPASQNLTLSDGKMAMEIDFKDRKTRQALVDDYRQEQDHITHFLRKISAPLLMISNEEDVAQQLRKYLGVKPQVN